MSLDFPFFEELRKRRHPAAKWWRLGDGLYYLGLLGTVRQCFRCPNCRGLLFSAPMVLGVFALRRPGLIVVRCSFRCGILVQAHVVPKAESDLANTLSQRAIGAGIINPDCTVATVRRSSACYKKLEVADRS